jgi:hypothetical protein
MIRLHGSKSPTNQISKDKTWKKKLIIQKDLKKLESEKKIN